MTSRRRRSTIASRLLSIRPAKSSCSRRFAPSSRRSIRRIERRSTAITRGSLSHPSSAGRDWNRSFETKPPAIRGGALLIHGLTDSPYSMRKHRRGAARQRHVLAGAAHARARHGSLGPGHGDLGRLAGRRADGRPTRAEQDSRGAPLILVGYSNGGALALKYTLDAIEGDGDPVPSKLILLSPMIGVTPAARLAWWISRLGVVPYFEKANWLDVLPEYNPFKYNSFAANAGFQTGIPDAHRSRTISRASRRTAGSTRSLRSSRFNRSSMRR